MFPNFRDVPLEQLEENESFRAHALQVTETVSLAVSALDDIPSLVLVLKDLGAAHSAHGIQAPHFTVRACSIAKRNTAARNFRSNKPCISMAYIHLLFNFSCRLLGRLFCIPLKGPLAMNSHLK